MVLRILRLQGFHLVVSFKESIPSLYQMQQVHLWVLKLAVQLERV